MGKQQSKQPLPPLPPMVKEELNSALLKAIELQHLGKIQQLMEHGACAQHAILMRDSSRRSDQSHPMHVAVCTQNIALISYLLETCKVNFLTTKVRNVQDGRHHTLIHEYDAFCAAIENIKDASTLNYLVQFVKLAGKINEPTAIYDYSSDRNYNDFQVYYDMTYLHYAAWRKNDVAMQVLIRHGANPYLRCKGSSYESTYSGKTPLKLYPGLKQIIATYANFGHMFHCWYCDTLFLFQ